MRDDYIHPLSINGQLMKKDARIAELEAENAELTVRCQAMFSLLPDEIKIGDIQKAVAALNGEMWKRFLTNADEALKGDKSEQP